MSDLQDSVLSSALYSEGLFLHEFLYESSLCKYCKVENHESNEYIRMSNLLQVIKAMDDTGVIMTPFGDIVTVIMVANSSKARMSRSCRFLLFLPQR